jgi:YHS domain-containing protein
MRENGPKLESTSDVTAVYPARPANITSGRYEVQQKNDQPLAPAVGSTKADAAVVLAGSMEPERHDSLPCAPRADAIAVTAEPAAPVEPAAYAFAESAPKPAAVNRMALPAVALGGYCPVELCEKGRWVTGDLRWTVVHRGWIYRLAGAEQRQQFLADPDRFAPVDSGNDVVLSVTRNRSVPGKTACCAIYNNHLYMFSSEATQAEFNRNPERYAVQK